MNIGVTGHQKLSRKLISGWIDNELETEISKYKNIDYAYSSLAIGADQVFAEKVLQLNINLAGIIPCLHYEDTFDGDRKVSYFSILSKCGVVETLDFPQPSEKAFFSAGKRVVENSDVVFAIWDGRKANGLGGTGDVVEYALSLKKRVVHLNTVLKIKLMHNF